MRHPTRAAFAALILALTFGVAPAWAQKITDLDLKVEGDALLLVITGDADMSTPSIKKSGGDLLVVTLPNATAKKRLIKTSAPVLSRAAISPGKGGTDIRLRFKAPLADDLARAAKIDVQGEKTTIRIPVDEKAAKAWLAGVAKDVKKEVKKEAVAAAVGLAAALPKPAAPRAVPAAVSGEAVVVKVGSAGTPVQQGIQAVADHLAEALESQDPDGLRRVAVLPLEDGDAEVSKHNLGKVSGELLSARLAKRPKILQVERARLDGVISELKRADRGELSSQGAVSVGKLLGANALVLGTVTSAGPNYIVTARAVDTESGRIIAAADHDFERGGMVAFSEDVVEIKSRLGAGIRSAVLPGWGQVYNGDVGRGVTYMVLYGGAAAGAITSMVLGNSAKEEYQKNTASTVEDRQSANDHYDRSNLFLIGLGVVWATAVVDAYLTGHDVQTIQVTGGSDGETTSLGVLGRF